MSVDLQNVLNEAERDEQISKKKKDKPREWALATWMPEVNDYACCIALLERLNTAIDTLWMLADDYYKDYIFNASTTQNEQLKDAGFDVDDLFIQMAEKLEKLRAILYGHSINWEHLLAQMKDDLLGHEVYWRKFYEKRVNKLQREVDRK